MTKLYNIKISRELSKLIKKNLVNVFESNLDVYYKIVMDSYESELNSRVLDRRSKSKPEDYMSLFFERLKESVNIEENNTGIVFRLPSMDTFNFNGLEPIRHILEGTPGVYVEMSVNDFEKIFGKKAIRFIRDEAIINPDSPKKDQYVIVPFNGNVRKAEVELGKKFVRFPFSGVPPISIIDDSNDKIDKEVSKWIDSAISTSIKEFEIIVNRIS